MLFDTGAMKSVMSLEMYKKLKLEDLDTTSIPHVVGASGESLGARGRTKCEVNINGRIFYQTFIVCEHLFSVETSQFKIVLVFHGQKQTLAS